MTISGRYLNSLSRLPTRYSTLTKQASCTATEILDTITAELPGEPDCNARLILSLTLSPLPEFRDAERAVAIARRIVPGSGGLYRRYLALASLRAEKWLDAIHAAHEAMTRLEGGDSIDWLILAMASWKNGDRNDAQLWFNKAIDHIDQGQPIVYDDMGPVAARQLRKEAEQMIVEDQ